MSGFAPGREAMSLPGVTVTGGPRGLIGYGRGPRASTDDIAVNNYIRLGRRDEKLMNVSDVKVFDEEHVLQYERNRIYILKFQQDVAQQAHVFSFAFRHWCSGTRGACDCDTRETKFAP